jgi:hypothetical protein
MFRKTALALATIAALGTTVIAPTTASAGWKHHPHFHGHFHRGGGRWIGPALFGAAILGTAVVASCYRRQWVDTPYGPRPIRVNVC